jgi:hypothetical protein
VKPVFRKFTEQDYAAIRDVFEKYIDSEKLKE